MVRGTPKFDAVSIGSLMADLMGGTSNMKLEAKVAFVDSTTGTTHGWTTQRTFGPAVLAKLRELTLLMEEEIGALHFSEPRMIGVPGPALSAPSEGLGGLGEHLGKGEAPQV